MIYFLLIIAFFMEMVVTTEQLAIMNMVYALFSIVMASVMGFAMRRIVRYLRYLSTRGVEPARKTMAIQLISLVLIAVFNFSSFFLNLQFAA